MDGLSRASLRILALNRLVETLSGSGPSLSVQAGDPESDLSRLQFACLVKKKREQRRNTRTPHSLLMLIFIKSFCDTL